MVSVRLSEELFDKLTEKAEENHETVSDLIRRMLRSTFDLPIGYRCKHMVVVFPTGEDDFEPSLECGCKMKPIYDMSEVLAVRPQDS